MSHFTVVKTQYQDVPAMQTALSQLGFTVQVSKFNLLQCRDYYGNALPVKCCLVATGSAKVRLLGQSQLGFVKGSDGLLEMHVDGMARNAVWQEKLPRAYSYARTMALIKAKGYTVDTETTSEQIHIKIHRSW